MDDTHFTCKHLVVKLTSLNTQHFLLEGEVTNTRKAVVIHRNCVCVYSGKAYVVFAQYSTYIQVHHRNRKINSSYSFL